MMALNMKGEFLPTKVVIRMSKPSVQKVILKFAL